MKKIKKIVAILMAGILMLMLCACGSSIKISSDSRLSNMSGELSGISITSNKHPDSEYVEVRGKVKALRDIDRDFQIYITIYGEDGTTLDSFYVRPDSSLDEGETGAFWGNAMIHSEERAKEVLIEVY